MAGQMWEIIKEIVFRNRERHAIPSLDGPLRPNDGLDLFSVVCKTFQNPDDIAINAMGVLYLSTENRVVRLSGESYKNKAIVTEFEGPAGGLSFHPDGDLMVCIGERGVIFVNDAGMKTSIQTAEGQPIRCPKSAVAAPDGEIYIADGSTHNNPEDWVFDLMEKNAAGRLIRYKPDTGKSEILLSGLSYPHGVAITHDGRALLLTESWNHSLLRYPLDDIRPSKGERVIGNMPGYPARIIQSSDGGYWMSLFAMRTRLVDLVLTEDKYRKAMMRRIDPVYWVAPALRSGKDFLEPLQAGAARTLGVMKPWAPPRSYGLVIKLDRDLKMVKSLHSRIDGDRHGITGLCEHDGELYVASKGHGLILKGKEEVLH